VTIRSEMVLRIRESVREFREVSGAASLEAVMEGRVLHPGAYVFPESSKVGENRLVGAIAQRESLVYAIVIVTRNVRDAKGADSDDESEYLRDEIRAALLGWQPEGAGLPLEHAGGELIIMKDGILYYLERYRTDRFHWKLPE